MNDAWPTDHPDPDIRDEGQRRMDQAALDLLSIPAVVEQMRAASAAAQREHLESRERGTDEAPGSDLHDPQRG